MCKLYKTNKRIPKTHCNIDSSQHKCLQLCAHEQCRCVMQLTHLEMLTIHSTSSCISHILFTYIINCKTIIIINVKMSASRSSCSTWYGGWRGVSIWWSLRKCSQWAWYVTLMQDFFWNPCKHKKLHFF